MLVLISQATLEKKVKELGCFFHNLMHTNRKYLFQRLYFILTGSGATYVRWGRTICPDVNGTEKVYDGQLLFKYDKLKA